MVDGVNFNPFTNKVWTTEEIEKLDTDKNGTVSYAEMQANISWLAGSADEEGEVLIGEESSPSVTLSDNESKIYNAAAKNGVQDQAADSSQLQQYMNTVIDSYIEQYMQKNPGLEQNQKSSLITFIKTQGQEFVNNYIKNNTAVPYNTQSVAQSLIQTLDSAVQQRNETATEVNNTINDYKNNVDANYDKLSATTDKADDDYVTSAEFQQMKEEAIAYLMGTMLNGAEDSEFLAGLNPNYKNDANYKIAMAAINAINNESDPAKLQEYLQQAKTALSNLIGTQNVDGTSKLNNTVITSDTTKAEAEKAEQTAEYTETLTATIDEMVENYSNSFGRNAENISEKISDYKTQLTNIMNKFLETYDGSGKNIESEFKVFANDVMRESVAVKNELAGITSTDSADAIEKLENVVEGMGSYISDDESQQVINASVDFIMNQLAQGISDISLLEQISPAYTTNDKFIEAQALLNGIESSATPKEDLEKVKQLLTEMMTEIGAEKIADGVKNRQMPEITFSDVEREQFTSSIPGYDNNVTISSDSFKGKECGAQARDNLQTKAKQMLENLKPQLLEMLRDKMGADYNEDTANKLIDDAIYQTINDITGVMNIDHTNKIIHKKRKWTATISTQQLIDTFMNNLLANSAKDAAGPEEGKNPVDRESVMRNTSLADAYQDKSQTVIRNDAEAAKNTAKAQLQIIAAQLKAQLMSELGSEYNSTQINSLIDQAILNTVASLPSITESHGILKRHQWQTYIINTNTIANTFFDEFDKLYEEANK